MKVLRAILGALCGYLIFALTGVALGVLSGRNLHAAQPLWFVALTASCGVLFAGLGGLAASRIAPHRGWAVVGMTCLLALGAAASLVTSPAADAQWSQWSAILLMAPSAYLVPPPDPTVGGRSTTRRQADDPHMRMETGESTSTTLSSSQFDFFQL